MALSIDTWLKNWNKIVSVDYIKDRLDLNFFKCAVSQSIYELRHPISPWITIEMINILENYLKPTDTGFEFGSGSSTIWFGKKTEKVVSVEHDPRWHEKVRKMIDKHNLNTKIQLVLVDEIDEERGVGADKYIKPMLKIKDNCLDYCFIDGLFRDDCILMAIKKLKSNGVLIIDNVDNYFPRNAVSISIRYKRDNFSKTVSKTKMKAIYAILDSWRCIWTSSAVQDTAMWIKP
jgi:hypothetical protein